MKLCSACLLGMQCRYDAKRKPNKAVIRLAMKEPLIPVCPEQLGGLSTPREQTERKGRKVLTKSGKDLTESFKTGAIEALRIAKTCLVKEAIFKQRSPACGVGRIYDGTFSGKVIDGNGVTTELLIKNGIKVISEEEV